MEITGTITHIFEVQELTPTFKKKEFIINSGGQYPQSHLVQLTNDKIGVLNKFKIGDEVTCGINLRGRLFTRKSDNTETCMNLIEVWKLNPATESNNEF